MEKNLALWWNIFLFMTLFMIFGGISIHHLTVCVLGNRSISSLNEEFFDILKLIEETFTRRS